MEGPYWTNIFPLVKAEGKYFQYNPTEMVNNVFIYFYLNMIGTIMRYHNYKVSSVQQMCDQKILSGT